MKPREMILSLLPVYAIVFLGITMCALIGNQAVATIAQYAQNPNRHTIIIDPGHGGVDGGATSCTGILESKINLDIALRLDDTMHLLGMDTLLIRRTDCSVYTQGETIAQKKVSDLRERVRIINETDNAFLISIHQNTFPDGKYWGLQTFYAAVEGSKSFAEKLQVQYRESLMPDNNRRIKQAKGIYLMEHIKCPGILLECGFLSNPREEALLRSAEYQINLCALIAATSIQHLSDGINERIL